MNIIHTLLFEKRNLSSEAKHKVGTDFCYITVFVCCVLSNIYKIGMLVTQEHAPPHPRAHTTKKL